MSNAAAIVCGIAASMSRKVWWIDPLGGILVSAYIIYSWALICKGQGKTATCPGKVAAALAVKNTQSCSQ